MFQESEDFFEKMMSRISNEFPECSSVHVDWEFILKDKVTQEIKNKKKLRLLAIQNIGQNYQNVVIIITKLGYENVQLPDLVEKFISEIGKSDKINSNDYVYHEEIFNFSQINFTRNIYLYTDKLIVSEESIRKHFQKTNWMSFIRIV